MKLCTLFHVATNLRMAELTELHTSILDLQIMKTWLMDLQKSNPIFVWGYLHKNINYGDYTPDMRTRCLIGSDLDYGACFTIGL